jgi:hypothetical protein
MLSDPFKYQDYVQKFLDGIEEEEEGKAGRGQRKRTRSSNYLKAINQTKLANINEEFEDKDLGGY